VTSLLTTGAWVMRINLLILGLLSLRLYC